MSLLIVTQIIKSSISITLDPIQGKIQRVVNTHASSSITVSPTGGSAISISSGAVVDFWYDGSDWKIMNNNNSLFVGQSMQILSAYKAISSTFPWLCLSLPDATLSTANYSADFITEMRSRKVVYDEFNTNVSAFGGTWVSNVFTLTDNVANNAMLAELAEDWLFAGSPTTNWRILSDGANEFNITGISVVARTITVNLDSKTASGGAVSIYLNRVYGSTTSCRHFSWAGLGLYMTGQNKITGLRRRDKAQGWQAVGVSGGVTYYGFIGAQNQTMGLNSATNYGLNQFNSTVQGNAAKITAGSDGVNGIYRSGPKTEIESATAMLYLYVGAYAA